jgi:hypothetical protein
MPDGTISNVQLDNTCALGQRPDRTPIYVSGVNNTRAFLAWL